MKNIYIIALAAFSALTVASPVHAMNPGKKVQLCRPVEISCDLFVNNFPMMLQILSKKQLLPLNQQDRERLLDNKFLLKKFHEQCRFDMKLKLQESLQKIDQDNALAQSISEAMIDYFNDNDDILFSYKKQVDELSFDELFESDDLMFDESQEELSEMVVNKSPGKNQKFKMPNSTPVKIIKKQKASPKKKKISPIKPRITTNPSAKRSLVFGGDDIVSPAHNKLRDLKFAPKTELKQNPTELVDKFSTFNMITFDESMEYVEGVKYVLKKMLEEFEQHKADALFNMTQWIIDNRLTQFGTHLLVHDYVHLVVLLESGYKSNFVEETTLGQFVDVIGAFCTAEGKNFMMPAEPVKEDDWN